MGNKSDYELGLKVRDFLISKGVETPLNRAQFDKDAFKKVSYHFSAIMDTLNLNLSDDSLINTPKRVAKMYLEEVFKGLDYRNFPKVSTFENKMKYDEMITVRDIKVHSFCEHHFIPIVGTADVAYLSNGKIVGLSKINRIVDFFSRRPQVQERLTEQIYWALVYVLGTENIAVRIQAKHLCVIMRGIKDVNSDTVTTKLGGVFLNSQSRNEFLQLINK